MSRIGFLEKVFRGIGVRAFKLEDFKRGVYVEMEAQSFTRVRSVAHQYSTWGGEGRASYILEVEEGEADKGADISPFSFYPHEKEKLYGPLAMMQVTSKRIQMSIASNLVHDLELNDAVRKLQVQESRMVDFENLVR